MLGEDYPRLLGNLMSRLPQKIQLPEGMENFFEESGPAVSASDDIRSSARTRVRTHGVLIPEQWLPAFQRSAEPTMIYTCDFSKNGFGFVSAEQYYPGEVTRILLATFWMRITIRRCRRLGPSCYDCGATLNSQHEQSVDAFQFDAASEVLVTNA